MKKLYQVINNNNLSEKKIVSSIRNSIVLKSDFFYSVKLIASNNQDLHLVKNWRFGILGKYIYPLKYKRYKAFVDRVEACLKKSNFKIIPLNYFPQSSL
jgi:hypothetical protein